VRDEIVRAASEADMITLGRTGWALTTGAHLGSVARSLAEEGQTSLLMVEQDETSGALVLVYDGSAASARALELTIALAGDSGSVTVIPLGAPESAQADAAAQLKRNGIKFRFEEAGAGAASIAERIRASGARTALVPVSVLPERAHATAILESLNCSVFLVR
jgi:nucleotide-binding universal stress UspA family protein